MAEIVAPAIANAPKKFAVGGKIPMLFTEQMLMRKLRQALS